MLAGSFSMLRGRVVGCLSYNSGPSCWSLWHETLVTTFSYVEEWSHDESQA